MGTVNSSIASANFADEITPNDSTVFDPPTRAVYVGGGGDVAVRMASGQNDVVFVGVAAGTVLSIAVDKVKSTNTTATDIVGMW